MAAAIVNRPHAPALGEAVANNQALHHLAARGTKIHPWWIPSHDKRRPPDWAPPEDFTEADLRQGNEAPHKPRLPPPQLTPKRQPLPRLEGLAPKPRDGHAPPST